MRLSTWRMRTLRLQSIHLLSGLLLMLCSLTACQNGPGRPAATSNAVTSASMKPTITLYRLDGDAGRQPDVEDTFHEWDILGTRIITDPARQQDMMTDLQAGIDDPDARQMRSFIPRHGIRRQQENGQTLDYVICFQCGSYHLYRNDERAGGGTIGPVDFLRSFPNANKNTR